MKKLFYLAAIVAIMLMTIIACNDTNNSEQEQEQPPPEEIQDYTSFIIKLENYRIPLPNVVSGYFDKKGYCWKIAEHGILLAGQETEETIITINVDSVYIFSDYLSVVIDDYLSVIRLKDPFVIRKNRKNIFNISGGPLAIHVNKQDSLQYPQ
jgi:hypothetical protein